MKFTNTKINFKELGKDIKVICSTTVCLVKDTVSVPISICKDIRDSHIENKQMKEAVKKYTQSTQKVTKTENPKEEIAVKPRTRKPRTTQKLTPSQA